MFFLPQRTFQWQELSLSVPPTPPPSPPGQPVWDLPFFLSSPKESTQKAPCPPPTYHYSVCTAVLDLFSSPHMLLSHWPFCLEVN